MFFLQIDPQVISVDHFKTNWAKDVIYKLRCAKWVWVCYSSSIHTKLSLTHACTTPQSVFRAHVSTWSLYIKFNNSRIVANDRDTKTFRTVELIFILEINKMKLTLMKLPRWNFPVEDI